MQEAQETDLHCSNDMVQEFYDLLLEDIRRNRIILPSLPDIVLKIRDTVHDPDSKISTLAQVISTDSAISARIMKVVNSSLYQHSRTKADNLQAAISRLGTTLVNTLVTNLAIIQLMRCPRGAITEYLDRVFNHSCEVASIAFALARRFTKIDPEQAMLAGMVHDIGYLPILQKAVCLPHIWSDEQCLKRLLTELHAPVGGFILQNWGFNQDMVDMVVRHEHVRYINPTGTGLVDLIIVAELLSNRRDGNRDIDPGTIPAFTRLGIDLKNDIEENESFQSMLTEASGFCKS